jgi:hypothetical protein
MAFLEDGSLARQKWTWDVALTSLLRGPSEG